MDFGSGADRTELYEKSHGPPPPTLSVLLDPNEPLAFRRARRATVGVFDERAGQQHREDVALVAQELMTNALKFGAEPIRLLVSAHSSATLVAVFDAGARTLDAEVQQGHGLHIVDSVSALWGIDPVDAGKWVWASLR